MTQVSARGRILAALSKGAHIAVIGPIGGGKSTLVQALASELHALPLLERFEESPYLSRFYQEPTRWAFHHSVFFAEQSVRDQYGAQRRGDFAVQERILDEHIWVFGAEFHAREYLSDGDWDLLQRLARDLGKVLSPIDLLIYVDIAPEEALRRIKGRRRPSELAVTLDYMTALATRYEDLVTGWTQSEVLRLAAEKYDFRQLNDVALVAEAIRALVDKRSHAADSAARTTRRGEEHART
jgi:deoxyadenosine/deoxycytidine kinase